MNLPLEYLIDRSKAGLQDAHIYRVNSSRNCRKKMLNAIKGVVEDWVESRAEALVLQWFLEHGEDLIVYVLEQRAKPLPEEIREDKPPLTRIETFEHWRSERRFNRRKVG